MSQSIVVRKAEERELPLLLSILLSSFKEYEGRLHPPSGVHRETVETLAERMGQGGALLCEVEGVPAGCGFFARQDGYLYIGRLAVLPDYRRRGVGHALLSAGEQIARELGYERVRLGVRILLPGLQAYYEARRYRPIAAHSHGGHPEPTWIEMEKSLAGREGSEGAAPRHLPESTGVS